MPNPPVANPGVASTKRGVAGISSVLEMPTDSCHFPCTSDTLVRPHTHSHERLFQLPGLLAGGGGSGARQLVRISCLISEEEGLISEDVLVLALREGPKISEYNGKGLQGVHS